MADDDLLSAVLENTPAAELDFEHFLTLARRALLLDVVASPSTDHADPMLLRFFARLRVSATSTNTSITSTTEEATA